MSKKINDNSIQIDGAKLKDLLEGATGKTLKELSLENGFSDSFLRMVVKQGKATPTAQAVIRLYGIEPSAYEIKPEPVTSETDTKQITFDEVLSQLTLGELRGAIAEVVGEIVRTEVKEIVKGAVKELFSDFTAKDFEATYDERIQTYTLVVRFNKEKTYSKPKKAEDYLRALDPDRVKDDKGKFDERFEI